MDHKKQKIKTIKNGRRKPIKPTKNKKSWEDPLQQAVRTGLMVHKKFKQKLHVVLKTQNQRNTIRIDTYDIPFNTKTRTKPCGKFLYNIPCVLASFGP